MSVPLRIHVATVGFEVRRIADPLIQWKADMVYLISISQDDKAKKYKAKIREILKQEHPYITIEDKYADIWDLYSCVNAYREIFRKEKDHVIYVNVSTGSRIAAIAGTFACMLWGGTAYYAKLEYGEKAPDKIELEKVDKIDPIPILPITKPKPASLKILKIIDLENGSVRKSQLIIKLREVGIIRHGKNGDKISPAEHSQLRILLNPLEKDHGYVKLESSGRRSMVEITKKGKDALAIFGYE